ncbi:hypothetical protein EO087_04790 [Dyella sp. M7H15-1]|uniref:TrbC/VirB2 family protein n=1 Tax=Dyella sp. M7H15-1 TaxID=2501295 RepID=UPI0010050E1B|nr:TrbC/VirB2 family protein [Dyella sp. M7H15-1]QAU23379.1 hypothetical protein EO087_04790 [Dyella sp. M7H15-1]
MNGNHSLAHRANDLSLRTLAAVTAATTPAVKLSRIATRGTNFLSFALMFTIATLIIVHPSLAFTQDAASQLKTQANSALSWLWTGVYFILVVAVLGSGVMAAFGRMEWRTVGQVLIGCVVAGMATAVVQGLFGNSTNTNFG